MKCALCHASAAEFLPLCHAGTRRRAAAGTAVQMRFGSELKKIL